jgi:hypothetical protein
MNRRIVEPLVAGIGQADAGEGDVLTGIEVDGLFTEWASHAFPEHRHH